MQRYPKSTKACIIHSSVKQLYTHRTRLFDSRRLSLQKDLSTQNHFEEETGETGELLKHEDRVYQTTNAQKRSESRFD